MTEASSHAPGTTAWVDLASSDPQAAMAFYGELLGWEFAVGPQEAGRYTMCELRGLPVAGMVGLPTTAVPTGWTTYLATDDVVAAAGRFTVAGGRIRLGPMAMRDLCSVAVGTDPSGALVGLWQPDRHTGAAIVDEPGAVVWSELLTHQLAGAMAFYTDLAGWAWADEAVQGVEGGYQLAMVGERPAAGVTAIPAWWPSGAPPAWLTYFGVADADAAAMTVERLGGAVLAPPVDFPYGRFAVVADPQGGRFGLSATPP